MQAEAAFVAKYDISIYSKPSLKSSKICRVKANQKVELSGDIEDGSWIRYVPCRKPRRLSNEENLGSATRSNRDVALGSQP